MTRVRTHRSDTNQGLIVKALKEMGCTVQILSQVGGGCPDLLVGRAGKNYLLEVKHPGGKLREKQRDWHEMWLGSVKVVDSVWEALGSVGINHRIALEVDKVYRENHPEELGVKEAADRRDGGT